jgi:hypothetical protein
LGGSYSQRDESTGQTVDSYTSRAGAFMAAEDSTGVAGVAFRGSGVGDEEPTPLPGQTFYS